MNYSTSGNSTGNTLQVSSRQDILSIDIKGSFLIAAQNDHFNIFSLVEAKPTATTFDHYSNFYQNFMLSDDTSILLYLNWQ